MSRNRALRVLADAAAEAQTDKPNEQIAAVVAEVRQ
jgi:hypothetical protein